MYESQKNLKSVCQSICQFFNFFDWTTQAYQTVFILHKVSVPLKNDHKWKSIKCIWLCDTLLENPWEGDFKILKISKQINPAPQKIGLRP